MTAAELKADEDWAELPLVVEGIAIHGTHRRPRWIPHPPSS